MNPHRDRLLELGAIEISQINDVGAIFSCGWIALAISDGTPVFLGGTAAGALDVLDKHLTRCLLPPFDVSGTALVSTNSTDPVLTASYLTTWLSTVSPPLPY